MGDKGVTHIECENGHVTEQEVDVENLYGKVVDTEEQAYNLYVEHARWLGFDVRKGHKRYSQGKSEKILRQFNFLCSKEGFKLDSDSREVNISRLETRTGCEASIRFTIYHEKWKVTCFNGKHNHAFAKPEERQFLKINRTITNSHGAVLKNMTGAGIRTTNSYSYLVEEAGGFENVGFTKRDCYNFVNKQKLLMIEDGDAQSLINLFKRKQVDDPSFFYSVQVNEYNRMTNFFWRDGRSRCDYECFGDVVVFDTTYRTNRYNMICAPFVGINHHWNNVLFGCAFLLNETTSSFIWLFKTFLESMGGMKQPTCIITDQCQAMAIGIEKVFPKTKHRLCKWHISQNAGKHLGYYLANSDFKKYFNRCLYFSYTEEELQSNWDDMVEKFKEYNLGANKWLNTLYNIKEKWCSAFSPNIFSARVQASQRSESVNNVFHQISTKTMSLTEFVHHYDKMARQMRVTELEEDYRCNQGLPKKVTKNSGILIQAANLYTRTIFKKFEVEFTAGLAVIMKEVGAEGGFCTFLLSEEGQRRVHSVIFNSSMRTVSCSCKMFESKGILCRHALRVMNVNNFTEIPNQYVMKRWTKEAKRGIKLPDHHSFEKINEELLITVRRNELMRMAYGILSKSAETIDGTQTAKLKLREIEKIVDNSVVNSQMSLRGKENICGNSQVLDPPCVRPKGISNARLKNCFEKKKKNASNDTSTSKKRKVSTTKTTSTIDYSLLDATYDPVIPSSSILPCTTTRISPPSWSLGESSCGSFTNMLIDDDYFHELDDHLAGNLK